MIYIMIVKYIGCLKHHTHLGNSPIEFVLGDVAKIIQVKEFECFEEEGVDRHFGACFE